MKEIIPIPDENVPLDDLTTESAASRPVGLDQMDTLERLRAMNDEDAVVAAAVRRELAAIASAVEQIVKSFRAGGRLLYVGAGTSGRLGVLDASECPPTFGTDPSMVKGIIAGGAAAMFEAIEGAEDDAEAGAQAILDEQATMHDTVVGISASGQAPFVIGALRAASSAGASSIALVNNRPCQMEREASLVIAPIVGPEFIAGSTRLKAGTAQKMVLNMLSTNAMIEIGKTYGNLMVDVRATNTKLRARALRIVTSVAGVSETEALAALQSSAGNAKLAILMIKTGLHAKAAQDRLVECDGLLRRALEVHPESGAV